MTEKRFWYDFEDCTGTKMVDFKKDKEYSLETIGDFKEIENLLNALHEENIRLKRDFDSCSHNWNIMYDEAKEKVEKLTDENEQLKQSVKRQQLSNDECSKYIEEVAKENEQLKSELKVLKKRLMIFQRWWTND